MLTVTEYQLTLFWVVPHPRHTHDTLGTSEHKTSSSIIIIIVMADHLVRSGRSVQYRGRGYSNRFFTLQRLRTLPTPWSTWPRDPIRVDQRCSNETRLTRDSSIVPPALILPRRPALGGPYVLMTPATIVAKLCRPKRGLLSQTGTPA